LSWWSCLGSVPNITQDDYLDSFIFTRVAEIEEEVVDSQLLIENAFYGALNAPESESLANILPSEPARSPLYDLVNIDSKPKPCTIENQCVRFLEKMTGKDFNADAKNIPVNEDQPCENCGVVFWGGKFGHAAYVVSVESPSFEIVEQNHSGCGIIETRSINFEEANNIKGFIKN
jgi:hypothetical protein